MVLLHVKTSNDAHQFLFDSPSSTSIQELLHCLPYIHNLRLKVQRLADACRGLALYGPLRPEESRGLSEEVIRLSNLQVNSSEPPTHPDPTNFRVGIPPPQKLADVLLKTAEEAEETISHKKVDRRVCLSVSDVSAAFDNLRGAVMIAFPAFHNLPTFDPAREILEETEDLKGTNESKEILDESTAMLWWAGKEMPREKNLSDVVGQNDKTKIIVRLQPKASGPPVREPRIDEETHKAMLSFYHKKQQESKALEEDDDDSYLNSEWASQKSLKHCLIGTGATVRWRP